MVVKTDTCFYSELRIYPGHGKRFVRKDGKLVAFLNAKILSLYFQRIKSQNLTWSQQWRRKNKKGRSEVSNRRRKVKGARVFKSMSGLTVEELQKKRAQTTDYRKAARETYTRDVKDRKKAAKATKAKSAAYKKGKLANTFAKVPKNRRALATKAR